ncbi:MAG: LCP family protein [Eubacteriales bacterium]|nr:LCP family protein [Eubacteriales bacterium]
MNHRRISSYERSARHRRKRHNRKLAAMSAAVFLLAFAGIAAWIIYTQNLQKSRHVTAGASVDMGDGYRTVTYKGKSYQYNSLITTILYAGVDSKGEMKENAAYASAPRADSISLVVLDKKHQKMTIIAISRDTMTEIRRYTISGYDRGTYVSHLGYAYTYGDGGKVSCENLREAVAGLFGGIPVNEYAVTNQTSMTYINDLVDGITVTVPNNDLAALYPSMTEGKSVTLDASNVTDFLQYRDTSVSFSNEGRIERQQTYVTAYIQKLKEKLGTDTQEIWNKLENMEPYLQTSITKNKYLNLVNLLKKIEFSDSDYWHLAGENQEGTAHDEFYVDEEALQDKIIEIFYEEIP